LDLLSESLVGREMKQSLYVLLAAVGMVLLIGCANLANLTLARGTAREREVAIRLALGAGRWRLIRQFLTETTLLSMGGGILGLAVGYVTLASLKTALPPFFLPREANVALDGRALAFALAVSAVTGILFGLVPSLRATRINLAATIREGGHGASAAGGRQRARAILVVSEMALAFMLLTCAGLLIRSFFAMMRADPGFDSTNVLTAGLPVSEKRFPDAEPLKAYQRLVTAAIAAVPGVREVALTSALPLQGWGYGMPFQIAGRPIVDRANRQACFFKMVTPNYFRALGMALRKGRALSEREAKGTPPAAVINDTMARKYFPNEDPLGKRILIQEIVPGKTQLGDEIPWEVVGVVGDEKVNGLDDTGDNPGVYVSNQQSPVFYESLLIRTAIDPASVYQAVRKAVRSVDKDQGLEDMRTLDQIKTESVAPDRLRLILLVVFASMAMLLSAVGIYGVVSYAVAQRTHEIGIRGALGASAADIVRLVLRYGMTMAAVGLAIGLAGALAATRLFSAILFGVGARDPLTMALTGAGLAAVALGACCVPALRAGRVDPVVALRHE
jgi:putative ABC transport system permease protein